MSSDSSDVSPPDWMAEHRQTQVPETSGSSEVEIKEEPAASTEHSSHTHRPAGPTPQSEISLLVSKQAAVAAPLVAAPELPGEIPVLLPEKLSALKCLVEVEDGTNTDLAGDAGAVGRFATTRHSQQQQAQLDLKGQIYHMNVVPCASTLCVLNIRQTEAKVEAIFPDYVQLRQDSGHVATQVQDLPYLFGDDDENYQEQGTGGAATSQVASRAKKTAPTQAATHNSKASASRPSSKPRKASKKRLGGGR
ncbi:TPA: hypothetical protein ACH3X2_012110 [Trebouxia sp. C0005]